MTPDGSRLLIQTQTAADESFEIRVIDASNPSSPIARGRLATASASELAMSDNGRRALVAEKTSGRQSHDAPSTYKVTSIDLSDPGKPRELWKRSITARAMRLAPDASALAYSMPTQPTDKHQEVMVVRSDQGVETRLSVRSYSTIDSMHIAPGARFIAFSHYGWTVADLARRPPATFERRQSRLQSDGCLLSMLPSGRLLVEDLRAPRFGIYAAQPNLPRIAKLTHGAEAGSSCQFTPRGRTDKHLLVQKDNGTLYLLDLSEAQHPSLSKPLLLPQGSVAVGLDANGRIYALRSTQGESRLEIYDAKHTVPSKVDWAALEVVHREALRIYGDKKLSEFERQWNAAHKFEDAGAFAALDAPVSGISNHVAASILNDYAFLLQHTKPPGNLDVQALLRRAIELDPDRRIAYLNLADALRRSLPFEPGPRAPVLAQARTNYDKYLALGGSPVKDMQGLAEDRLYRRPESGMCRAIVDFANAGRLGELIRSAATDVPAGGKKLDLLFTTEGTAHVPAVYAWDASDDHPIENVPTPGADGLWGGDELGLIMYGGAAHILHYRDASHPVASVAVSGAQSCDFVTPTVELVGSDALEPELCAQLMEGHGPQALKFNGPMRMTHKDVSTVYPQTALTGSRRIDVANDGNPINIGRFELSSTAGAGCDETVFDELDANAAHVKPGPRRDQLMVLQGADSSDRYPVRPCGNQPRFFAHKGNVYFETKPSKWPPIDQWNSYHRVTRIRQGQVEDVCHFSFKSTVELKNPPAKTPSE